MIKTEHDIIRFMGRFPDKINAGCTMQSKTWQCSKCGIISTFNEEVSFTHISPCNCGSIFFTKLRGE